METNVSTPKHRLVERINLNKMKTKMDFKFLKVDNFLL
jgi:hypothetical protein